MCARSARPAGPEPGHQAIIELLGPGWSWFVITLGVVIGGLTKGVTGLGLPLVAVPVIAAFLGVEFAVVVMAVPGIATNLMLLWTYRSVAGEMRHLPVMLLGGGIGTAVGTLLLRAAPERALSLALAVLVLGYLGVRVANPEFILRPVTQHWTGPTVGTLGGVLQGLTGVSGPLIAMYFHACRLRREAYVFSLSAMFQLYALVQVTSFLVLGLYTPERVVGSMLALVPALISLPVGMRLARRLRPAGFERVVLAVMLAMALSLLADGLGIRPW